jgi:hypothetical protein
VPLTVTVSVTFTHGKTRRQIDRLANRQIDVVLHERPETCELRGRRVTPWRQLQEHETAVAVGSPVLREVRLDADDGHVDSRQDGACRILHGPLNDAGRDLRLRRKRRHGDKTGYRHSENHMSHHAPPH